MRKLYLQKLTAVVDFPDSIIIGNLWKSGGQGEVYKSNDENFIVKILYDDIAHFTITNTIKIINRFKNKFGKDIFKIPCFQAFPLIAFKTILDAKEKFGIISKYLKNYEILDPCIDQIQNLEYKQKLQLCYQLSIAFLVFSEIGYVYIDTSTTNTLVDLKNVSIALIDFESGGLIDEPDSITSTLGKREGFEAPELALVNYTGNDRINLFSDWWSLAVMIFMILTGFHPFFFLNSIANLPEYIQNTGWPEIPPDITAPEIAEFQRSINELDPELLTLFKKTFNNGFLNASDRTSPFTWKITLEKLIYEPVVLKIEKNIRNIFGKKFITVKWKARNVNFVTINSKLTNPFKMFYPEDEIELVVDDTQKNPVLLKIIFYQNNTNKTISEEIEI